MLYCQKWRLAVALRYHISRLIRLERFELVINMIEKADYVTISKQLIMGQIQGIPITMVKFRPLISSYRTDVFLSAHVLFKYF